MFCYKCRNNKRKLNFEFNVQDYLERIGKLSGQDKMAWKRIKEAKIIVIRLMLFNQSLILNYFVAKPFKIKVSKWCCYGISMAEFQVSQTLCVTLTANL